MIEGPRPGRDRGAARAVRARGIRHRFAPSRNVACIRSPQELRDPSRRTTGHRLFGLYLPVLGLPDTPRTSRQRCAVFRNPWATGVNVLLKLSHRLIKPTAISATLP